MYLMALVGAPINANAMGDPTRYNLFFFQSERRLSAGTTIYQDAKGYRG